MVKTQFGTKVKCFGFNNAKKIVLSNFLVEQGTLHQFSCVERPQQNSIVERKTSTSIECGSDFIFSIQIVSSILILGRE